MSNVVRAKVLIKKVIKANIALPSGGTAYYDQLIGKPQINGFELSGNKSSEDLLLQRLMMPLSNEDIDNMFKE